MTNIEQSSRMRSLDVEYITKQTNNFSEKKQFSSNKLELKHFKNNVLRTRIFQQEQQKKISEKYLER